MRDQPAPEPIGPSDWDWDLAWDIVPEIWRGMVSTIQLTLVAIVLAMTLGLALAILRRSRLRIVRWPVGLFVELIRSTPLLVQLLFLFLVLADPATFDFLPDWPGVPDRIVLSPFQAAVIGLGVHYACYTSESYRAGIESVSKGQWEAATALNLSTAQTWRSVVLPQAIPTVLPALGNYLVASFKDAPLAAVVTLSGVLTAAQVVQGRTFRGVEAFTVAGVLFLLVSIPAAMFARYLEKRYGYQRD